MEKMIKDSQQKQYLVFESAKSFEEMERIVKFTNDKLSLKTKDVELTLKKELKSLVYSSQGDEYSKSGEGTRNTNEEKYFLNQYYLKIGSYSGDFLADGQKKKLTGSEIAGIAVGCVVVVAIIIVVPIVICKYKKKKDSSSNSN